MNRFLTAVLLALCALVGLLSLLFPFLTPVINDTFSLENGAALQPGSFSYGLLTAILVGISLLALLLEIQGQTANAKITAALGVLVAITSVLRLIETAIPGIGGFSPVFVPIILAGYVFGIRFGFLMGTLSVLTSAIITAGVGPWLPYQMFVAGWVGITAGMLPHPNSTRTKLLMLVLFAFVWGLLYGGILNLYFWPYVAGESLSAAGSPDSVGEIAANYGAFYLATSFIWDIFRALGNVVLILIIGIPAVKALSRFRDRFQFAVQ
jgi:energy-coupling factor transport system substrate-specific component